MILTLLHSERPKLYTILAFLSAIGLNLQFKLSVIYIPDNKVSQGWLVVMGLTAI